MRSTACPSRSPRDLVHYLLNKPAGVVTTASDPEGRPTVVGLVPAEPRVFPVGRLDVATEGLLILTNDGDLAQLLAHPSPRGREGVPGRGGGRPRPGGPAATPRRASSSRTAAPRRPGWAWWRPACSGSSSTRGATARSGGCARRSATRSAGWSAPGSARVADRPAAATGPLPVRLSARSRSGPRRGGPAAPRPRVGPAGRSMRPAMPRPPGPCAPRGHDGRPGHCRAGDRARPGAAGGPHVAERPGEHDVISIVFTATADVVSTFPATAARASGWGRFRFCAPPRSRVPGATPGCLRVLLHVYTTRAPATSCATCTPRRPGPAR